MKIQIHFPPDEFDETEIDEFTSSLKEIEGINAVYPYSRYRTPVLSEELLLAITLSIAISGTVHIVKGLLEQTGKIMADKLAAKIESVNYRSKIKSIPLRIELRFEKDNSPISFSFDTASPKHLKDGISIMPKVFEQHFEEMTNNRPPNVRSIRVIQDAKSGQFELAIGHNATGRPIYRYNFEKRIWVKT